MIRKEMLHPSRGRSGVTYACPEVFTRILARPDNRGFVCWRPQSCGRNILLVRRLRDDDPDFGHKLEREQVGIG